MYEPQEHPELIRRLERLEHENRRHRRVGGLGLLVLIAVFASAARSQNPKPAVVDASEFRVVDSRGRVRASLTAFEYDLNAAVGLRLFDENGNTCVSLHTLDFKAAETARTVSRLTFTTSTGTERLDLFADGAIDAGLKIQQPDFYRLGFPPGFTVDDVKKDPAKAHQLVMERGEKEDAPLFFAGFDTRFESSVLRLCDQDRHLRAALGACALDIGNSGIEQKRPTSSLVLFDEAGKVTFASP